jgi:RNA-dependent RNA polymerase
LGLSNSVPGLRLNLEDIIPEVEISASETFLGILIYSQLVDLIVSSTGSEMTDGCGYINRAALQRLRKKFEWHEFPTAIQFRFAGSKVNMINTWFELLLNDRAGSSDVTPR